MRISDWSSDVCSSDLREGAALARLEGDILDAVHAEGRWRADDPRLHVEVEQLLAGIGGIGAEAAGAGALEDEVARGRHRAAVPRGGIVDRPCDLAGARVEGDEGAGQIGRASGRARVCAYG